MTTQAHPELERAAELFKAMADPARLGLLVRLSQEEASVSELASQTGAAIGTVSARLKVLTAARLVSRRREGQTIIHALADHHVRHLLRNALAHAAHEACGPIANETTHPERTTK